jgi:hypothetical protein
VILSANGGTTPSLLAENAPVSLVSTGALSFPQELDITGVENPGRFFFLSVRNSDITTNNLTVTASTSINGGGTSIVCSSAGDFVFVHETGGVWRAYRLSLTANARIFRDTFLVADWTGGVDNRVTIIQTGAPAAGEIGPHGLTIATSYLVQIYRDSDDEMVDLGIEVDTSTGDISLTKTGLGTNFDGRVIVGGD